MADFTEEVLAENVSRSTIFKGMFLVANFNKTFQSKTFVVPDIAERLLGGLGTALQSLNKSRGQLVKLEDPEFEKLFAVYSEDQVEARYILSTSLMTRLAKFRKKAGREIYVSFIQDKIYIAIKSPQDLFEPKLFQTMLSFNPVREYFENLQLMMGVVEELKLNRRIWGGK